MKILLPIIILALMCPVEFSAYAQNPTKDKTLIKSVSIEIKDYHVTHEADSVIMHQGVIDELEVIISIETGFIVNFYNVGLVVNDSTFSEDGAGQYEDRITHKFMNVNLDTALSVNEVYAWAYLDDNEDDKIYSDTLKVYYEPNTPPIIQFDEEFGFDRVFTVPEVTLRGSVADTTGFIKEVRIDFNEDTEDISPDFPVNEYDWEYTVLFDAETPVNHIYVTAKDNIGGEYALESTLYWRLIYLDFMPKQTEFCPVDSLFTIEEANIPGGSYQGPGIVNETNLFNPYLAYLHAGAGTHQISYAFETQANSASITRNFEVAQPLSIKGNSMPCFNAYEEYIIELNGHSEIAKDVSVTGASEYEFDFDEVNDIATIGIWWDQPADRGNIVTMSAVVENIDFDCYYTINKLIAIDYDYTPGLAELKLFGDNLLVCSLNEDDYYYQWFKNDNPLTNAGKGRSFYHDPDFDPAARYCVKFWNNEFEKCKMEACLE